MKKKRIPKPIRTDTINIAKFGASTLDPVHQKNIADILSRAWERLQANSMDVQSIVDLAYASNVANELSHMGICSDEDSQRKIDDSQTIIEGLANGQSLTEWSTRAMEEAIFLFGIQLQFCSLSEFERARNNVNRAMADIKRGVIAKAHKVIKIT